MKRKYEIGGIQVAMTEAQAERWNAGNVTAHDLRTVRVCLPDEYAQPSYCRGGEVVMGAPRLTTPSARISLARATSQRLSPKLVKQMDGMPANLID